MRLLDLVEENDRIWLTANEFGQLTTLIETDIAGRRTDQSRNGVLLHVLGHVELYQRILATKEERRQSLGELCLADS